MYKNISSEFHEKQDNLDGEPNNYNSQYYYNCDFHFFEVNLHLDISVF